MGKKKQAVKTAVDDTQEIGNVEATAATNAEAPVVEQKDIQNGVARPKTGTKTGHIWEIADDLSNKLGVPVPRKDVLAQATAEGINPATAATQYGRWRKYYGLGKEEVVGEVTPAQGDVSVEG